MMFSDTTGLDFDSAIGSVVVIFDAADGGVGPEAFSKTLLDQLLSVAEGMTVVIAVRDADPRTWAVNRAVQTGGVVLLVEATDQHAQGWLDCVKRSNVGTNWMLWDPAVRGAA